MEHDHGEEITRQCCNKANGKKKKRDWIMIISCAVLAGSIIINTLMSLIGTTYSPLNSFTNASIDILLLMWWGVALGIIFTGLMHKVPREFFNAIMGKSDSFSGLLRAIFGGVLLDLCSHGILLIAAKLYERGLSLPQVIAFLIASPWNSFSLTLILFALIGVKWTLLYILGSAIIALITGMVLQVFVRKGMLPENPHAQENGNDFNFKNEAKAFIKTIKLSRSGTFEILKVGLKDGQMIIKWLLFGTIIAASLRAFVPAEMFTHWLGPSISGLFITLIIATIVEICSEGSAPIAGEIFTNAGAPGNSFTFLMAGVATDYTEIMVIREFTNSWKMALALPLITVPQVLLLGWLMNMASI